MGHHFGGYNGWMTGAQDAKHPGELPSPTCKEHTFFGIEQARCTSTRSTSFIGLPLLPNLWMLFKPSVSLSTSVSSSYPLVYSSFNHLAMRLARLGFFGRQHEFGSQGKSLELHFRCLKDVTWLCSGLHCFWWHHPLSVLCLLNVMCLFLRLPLRLAIIFGLVMPCLHVDSFVFLVLWV